MVDQEKFIPKLIDILIREATSELVLRTILIECVFKLLKFGVPIEKIFNQLELINNHINKYEVMLNKSDETVGDLVLEEFRMNIKNISDGFDSEKGVFAAAFHRYVCRKCINPDLAKQIASSEKDKLEKIADILRIFNTETFDVITNLIRDRKSPVIDEIKRVLSDSTESINA
jgi:hypothetical protein